MCSKKALLTSTPKSAPGAGGLLPFFAAMLLAQGALAAAEADVKPSEPPRTLIATGANTSVAKQEILAFERARRDAVSRVDVKLLDAMSSRDLVYVDAHGLERNKQQYLEHIATEGVHYNSYSLEDTVAKVYGDLAVTSGLFEFDVTVKGKNHIGAQYYTSVYVREDGVWKLLIWHPTSVVR